MTKKLLYIFTRTPLHVGAGSSVGAIDQPIQRERHTGFPIIPGSSIKGVLRDAAGRNGLKDKVSAIFGEQDNAGRISLGEAKIVAFPVRSARGAFAFVTCPLALERLKREHEGFAKLKAPNEPGDMECLAGSAVSISRNNTKGVVLEEYKFSVTGEFPTNWESALLGLLDDVVWQTAKGRFVLLNQGDFSHFVKNACEVNQHVGIDPNTGTARKGALFNLEAVPSETLFFAPMQALGRANGELDEMSEFLKNRPILQLGGDSTTGLGFCTVKLA